MKPNKNQNSNLHSFNFPFITIILILVGIWLLNIPIAKTLWRHSFDDGTYSHSYLIPFIILYLYYHLAKIGLLEFTQKLAVKKVILLAFSCICLFLTSTAQVSAGYWLSTLLVLLASINLVFRFNWYILFPATLLVFIFPIWGVLVPLLQDIAIKAVTFIMGFTGIPTYVENQYITIPAGVFEIAGGCSGLRYLIVSIAISSLFNFLYIKNIKRACLFLAVAIIGALIINWIRITALIIIGDYTDMQSSLMADHNTFGWYLYMPFMFALFVWGNKIANYDLLNTTHTTQNKVGSSSPHTRALLVLLLCLFASSTTIRSTLTSTENNTIIVAETRVKTAPTIHYYSQLILHENTDNSTKISYYFDGSELDGKPSYYENNLIPNGWKKISSTINNQWTTYYISNGYSHALVNVNYEIDREIFPQLRAFKIARLTKAVKNINQTKLNWQFTPCQKLNCQDELQNL